MKQVNKGYFKPIKSKNTVELGFDMHEVLLLSPHMGIKVSILDNVPVVALIIGDTRIYYKKMDPEETKHYVEETKETGDSHCSLKSTIVLNEDSNASRR